VSGPNLILWSRHSKEHLRVPVAKVLAEPHRFRFRSQGNLLLLAEIWARFRGTFVSGPGFGLCFAQVRPKGQILVILPQQSFGGTPSSSESKDWLFVTLESGLL
jgi:hypothetical protein